MERLLNRVLTPHFFLWACAFGLTATCAAIINRRWGVALFDAGMVALNWWNAARIHHERRLH
jgi:hypothetical protein